MGLVAFSGCASDTPNASDISVKDQEPINENISPEIIEITGGYSYYVLPDDNGSYSNSILNRLCFEPAQLEIVNDGEIFCFRDTKNALSMFRIKEDINENCNFSAATIKIKDLSDKSTVPKLKSDTCVADGNCEFNEATLVEIVEDGIGWQNPDCLQYKYKN